MNALRILVLQTRLQFVWGFLRSGPIPLLWTALWPAAFLIVFSIAFDMNRQNGGSAFLVPGLIGVQLIILGVSGFGVQLAGMRERQMLRNIYLTPLPAWVFFGALILFRYAFVLIQVVAILVVGIVVFHTHFTGDAFSIAFVLFVGSLAFVAIGALVGALARDVESANAVSMLVSGPMVLFSDGYIPIDRFPKEVVVVARWLPTTQFIDALRGVATGGEPLSHFAPWIAALAVWAIGAAYLTTKLFKWVT